MTSSLIKRNVTVRGRRTSIRLEASLWDAIEEICRHERCTIHDICSHVEAGRDMMGLTTSLRMAVLNYFRAAATVDGHAQAGHGCGLLFRVVPDAASSVQSEIPSPV